MVCPWCFYKHQGCFLCCNLFFGVYFIVDLVPLENCSLLSLGMGSMPNLSIPQPLPPVAPITTPLSSATSGTSIPPLMMPAPLVPSVSTSSLPNGTASLIQPLSIPYSSSSKCLVSETCEGKRCYICCSETSFFVELSSTDLFPFLSPSPSIASCIILQFDDGRIWWC